MQKFAVAMLLGMAAGQVLAAAARVDFVYGNVTVAGLDGREQPLARGADLDNGDTVRTWEGRAQLRFTDGAYVSLQPQSEFAIRDYRFDGKTDGTERGFFGLLKGAMRAVTGLVGRVNRDQYQITTPTATIGIRGTGGVIQVRDDGSTLIVGTSGIWSLTNPAGSIDVPAGVSALAPSNSDAPPQRTSQPPQAGPAPLILPAAYVQGDQRGANGDLTTHHTSRRSRRRRLPESVGLGPRCVLHLWDRRPGRAWLRHRHRGNHRHFQCLRPARARRHWRLALQARARRDACGLRDRRDPDLGPLDRAGHAAERRRELLGEPGLPLRGRTADAGTAHERRRDIYARRREPPDLPRRIDCARHVYRHPQRDLRRPSKPQRTVPGRDARPHRLIAWTAAGTTSSSSFSLATQTPTRVRRRLLHHHYGGFFAGASAERAGVGYSIEDAKTVVGAAAFKQ